VDVVPLFMTKKEVFAWLKDGAKTIDVRKGAARRGDVAVFQSGPHCLELPIIRKETGKLTEVVRKDNFRQIISTAQNLEEALDYLRRLYPVDEAIFTAYYLRNQIGNKT
jgi:ASC-1-like (ASCH) protein